MSNASITVSMGVIIVTYGSLPTSFGGESDKVFVLPNSITNMNVSCRVTKKGQVTIPKRLRQALGIEVGEKITFGIEDEKIVIRKLIEDPIEDLTGLGKGIFGDGVQYQKKMRGEWL